MHICDNILFTKLNERKIKMQNLLGIIVSYVYIGVIIIAAKFFTKVGEEASRKFIHIMLANWWFIAMYFFTNVVWACIVPISFVVINYISYKKNLISVMERSEQDGLGTVYYALSLFLMAIFTFGIIKRPEVGLCASLVMGYGDGLASIVGQSVKSYEYKIGNTKKTIAGSVTMFIISVILLAVFLYSAGSTLWILKSIIIAVIMTIVEAVSIKGTDNLTVPITISIILSLV